MDKAPYRAMAIVNAFINLAIKDNKPLSQLSLHKLIYLNHAFSLAMHDTPLIQEEFIAWKYGPVIPAVYDELKIFGKEPIQEAIDATCILSPQDTRLNQDIYNNFAKQEPFSLVHFTHNIGGAWHRAYNRQAGLEPLKNDEIKQEYLDFIR